MGGAKEIRRRSAQIVLADGNAELQLIKDENDKMKWIAEGSIQLEPATNFAQIKDGNSGKDAKNNLPVKDGWNFLMRVYQPKIDDLNKYEIPIPLKVD